MGIGWTLFRIGVMVLTGEDQGDDIDTGSDYEYSGTSEDTKDISFTGYGHCWCGCSGFVGQYPTQICQNCGHHFSQHVQWVTSRCMHVKIGHGLEIVYGQGFFKNPLGEILPGGFPVHAIQFADQFIV